MVIVAKAYLFSESLSWL